MTRGRSADLQRPWLRAGWLLLSFFGGLQIMLLEVAGFRVLQTNLGSSVLVTGTLLTVIMIVLSVGYYLGGVLSQKVESGRVLLLVLLASVGYTYVVDSLYLDAIADIGYALRESLTRHPVLQAGVPAAALSLVLYGPPVLAMSMISPFLIRLETERTGIVAAGTGKQSGFFMSLSTAGSIAGTLLASYLLIPLCGVRTTVSIASGAFLLLLVALLMSERRARWEMAATGALLVLAAISVAAAVRAKPNSDVLYERESFYGNIRVVGDTDIAGRPRLSYRPSRLYTHSVLYPSEPLRELVGSLYLLPALDRPTQNILVLGSAAGGVLRQAEQLFPTAALVGVDLDSSVHEAAVQAFAVDAARSRLVTSDARAFLATDDEQFDLIIVDLFAGEFIPSHCVTTEFFQKVKRRLRPEGAVFINTNMNDVPFELGEDEPFRAFRHLVSTLREAGFPSLFENLHFHSIYAYPRALELAAFQQRVRAVNASAAQPPAVRAAAGLALHTTVAVPHYEQHYRPFTDAWSPELLIERKSNKQSLFERFSELTPADRERAIHDRDPVALRAVEHVRKEGERDGDYWALRNSDALIRELNRVTRPLDESDRARAARYLHFGVDEAPSTVRAETPWATVAQLYARLYTEANANDYEGLLATLPRLEHALASGLH